MSEGNSTEIEELKAELEGIEKEKRKVERMIKESKKEGRGLAGKEKKRTYRTTRRSQHKRLAQVQPEMLKLYKRHYERQQGRKRVGAAAGLDRDNKDEDDSSTGGSPECTIAADQVCDTPPCKSPGSSPRYSPPTTGSSWQSFGGRV